MSILAWLVVGLVAGFLASTLLVGFEHVSQARFRASRLQRFLLAFMGRPACGGEHFKGRAYATIWIAEARAIDRKGARKDASAQAARIALYQSRRFPHRAEIDE